MGQRLSQTVGPGGGVARLGGDEFVVVVAPTAGIEAYADRLISSVAQPLIVEGTTFSVTVSVGVVLVSPHGEPSQSIHAGDSAMGEVKRSGGNGYERAGAGDQSPDGQRDDAPDS